MGGKLPTSSESKFAARELVLGPAEDCTLGIESAIGIGTTYLGTKLRLGEQAIVDEFKTHGNEEDLSNLSYVLHGVAQEEESLPPHVKAQIASGSYHGGSLAPGDYDYGHGGMTFDDFASHEHCKLAGLNRCHVLALRLYTTSSYPRFNGPLRRREKPHPFAMCVYYLFHGLKRLRSVAAQLAPEKVTQELDLWRGMQDMAINQDSFLRRGGTELAAMSTSGSRAVASAYAASATPLIFRYKTRGLNRGCSIEFLSVYPKEREYLYPPLTYLQPEGGTHRRDDNGYLIVDITPQIA